MRILIDECLSPALVEVAHDAGFEAYHVAHRGWSRLKDTALVKRAVEGGLTFMTNNRDDFVDLVKKVDLHAGLIVIVPNVPRDRQKALFRIALLAAATLPDTTNTVIEIDEDGVARAYELPGM